MSKIAFVFPGQGAQYVGMGKDIIEHNDKSKEVFERAQKVLDFDLQALCFNENEQIHITEFTQPALLTVSIALLKAVEEVGLKADYVAGLSLGEYSALVANGALDFEEAVDLVRKRGIFMEEAAKRNQGSMAAVMGSDLSVVKEICDQTEGIVDIANYNSPSQVVIAGELEPLKVASTKLIEKELKVIPLSVSGAFHSMLMKEAADRLEDTLAEKSVSDFTVPYATNVTGGIVHTKEEVKNLLVRQVYSGVKWEACVRTLMGQGVTTFIEIGPGKTLSGLIKKIDRSVKVINIEDSKSLDKIKELMEGTL